MDFYLGCIQNCHCLRMLFSKTAGIALLIVSRLGQQGRLPTVDEGSIQVENILETDDGDISNVWLDHTPSDLGVILPTSKKFILPVGRLTCESPSLHSTYISWFHSFFHPFLSSGHVNYIGSLSSWTQIF